MKKRRPASVGISSPCSRRKSRSAVDAFWYWLCVKKTSEYLFPHEFGDLVRPTAVEQAGGLLSVKRDGLLCAEIIKWRVAVVLRVVNQVPAGEAPETFTHARSSIARVTMQGRTVCVVHVDRRAGECPRHAWRPVSPQPLRKQLEHVGPRVLGENHAPVSRRYKTHRI